MMHGGRTITSIQAARGVAALAVVLSHSAEVLSQPHSLGHQVFGGFLRQGHAGVDFFFVLSGFIIFVAHDRDVGAPGRLLSYFFSRTSRIYPNLWMVLALTYGLFLAPGVALQDGFILNALLLPSKSPVGVTWTLQHEMLFYVMFSAMIVSRTAGRYVLSAWFLGCLVSNVVRSSNCFPWAPDSLFFDFFLSSYNLDFALGICAALIYRMKLPMQSLSIKFFMLSAMGFLTTAIEEHNGAIALTGQMARFGYGISAFLLVVGCAVGERCGEVRSGRIGLFLGSASYSIYLIHLYGISQAADWATTKSMGDGAALAVVALAGSACGVALHLAWEAPVAKGLKALRSYFAHGGRGSTVPSEA